jgi:membrane protein YdbS with pleckstrin-like domain
MFAAAVRPGDRSLRKGFDMKCSQCSGEVPANSMFCPQCGAQLAAASSQGKTAAAARLRPGSAGTGNQPSETDLWAGTYSPKAMVGPADGLGILTLVGLVAAVFANGIGLIIWGIGAAVLWLLLAIVVWYRRLTVRYRLTNFRFFHETGLLNRTRNRIEVIDINDVTLQQKLIERMFNVGTIHIQSSDVTHPDINLHGIEDVRQVTDLIDNTRRAERQRRGVFMENIGTPMPGMHSGS